MSDPCLKWYSVTTTHKQHKNNVTSNCPMSMHRRRITKFCKNIILRDNNVMQ